MTNLSTKITRLAFPRTMRRGFINTTQCSTALYNSISFLFPLTFLASVNSQVVFLLLLREFFFSFFSFYWSHGSTREENLFFILMATFVLTSPNILYWSRFMRNEILVLCFQLLAVISLFKFKRLKYPLFALSMALHFSAKENFFITIFLIITFYFLWFLFSGKKKMIGKPEKRALLTLILSLLLFLSISFWFFSAELRYPEGFLDGLYCKSLVYWWEQHSTHRIEGRFMYQFKNLMLLEPVLIFIFIYSIF